MLPNNNGGGFMHQSTWVVLLLLLFGEIAILGFAGLVLWFAGEFGDEFVVGIKALGWGSGAGRLVQGNAAIVHGSNVLFPSEFANKKTKQAYLAATPYGVRWRSAGALHKFLNVRRVVPARCALHGSLHFRHAD